jgi:flagellar hook-length control protein FliK
MEKPSLKGGEIMNMLGLLNVQTMPTKATQNNSVRAQAQVDNGEMFSGFQQLLSTELTEGATLLDADLASLPLDMLNQLYQLLVGDVEEEHVISEDEAVEEITGLIEESLMDQSELGAHLLTQLKADNQIGRQQGEEITSAIPVNTSIEYNAELSKAEESVVQQQYSELFTQVKSLLANLSEEDDIVKASPRILAMLEKWTELENRYSGESNRFNVNQLLTEPESDEKVLAIWRELVSTFQKRNEMATNQLYQTSSKVTSKDISKWVQNVLNTHASVNENVNVQHVNVANQPLSKVEQYVIYMNQTETSQSMDKQLIDQFQQVMRTSRFLSMNNGVNQLSIALRPDNLGEMMVRFTEVNGEMTLKIIVSSQATRQMLESNIHQLKNVFAPHQVVIEERDVAVENIQNQHEEQSLDEEQEDHSHESNKDENRNLEEDFEKQFQEILMNTKV